MPFRGRERDSQGTRRFLSDAIQAGLGGWSMDSRDWTRPLRPRIPTLMTETENDPKTLLSACRSLFGSALEISRKESLSEERLAQVGTARRCVDLALLSLHGGEVAVLAATMVSRHSVAASVADRLLSSLTEGAEEAKLEESAGSLFDPTSRADLAGSTDAIDMPDLLGFLQLQRKTGVLQVELEMEKLSFELVDGEVVCAYSDNSPAGCRLGEILVAQGGIDKERLGAFLIDHSSRSGKLGAALVSQELITEQQLRNALEFQVQEIFQRLLCAGRAAFRFQRCEVEELDQTLRMNVMQLLLESARISDEATQAAAES